MPAERRRIRAGWCAAVPAMLTAACGSGSGGAQGMPGRHDPSPAPDYAARRLGSDAVFHVHDARGQALLLTSFATWCTECRSELPRIQALDDRYRGRGLTVVGVDIDDGGDDASSAFARRLGVTFDLVRDEDHDYQAAFLTLGVPSSALIDRAGRLVHVWQGGFDTGSHDAQTLITRALGPPPAP